MLTQEEIVMKEALRAAIIAAIEEVGMDAFKRTSLFMSNHREGWGGLG